MRAVMLASLLSLAFMALAPDAAVAQSYGGKMARTKTATYELVATREQITIHVQKQSKGTTQGANASFQIVNGNGQVVEQGKLLAGNGNTLQARGPFKVGAGSKLTASIHWPHQNVTDKVTWALR